MALKFCLVCEIMEDITGHVTFIVIPTVSHEKSVENESFNVRTLYDYNPDADEYIPCKELGLFFKKGEILKIHRWVKIFGSKFLFFSLMFSFFNFIFRGEDENWWQAYKEGENDMR